MYVILDIPAGLKRWLGEQDEGGERSRRGHFALSERGKVAEVRVPGN